MEIRFHPSGNQLLWDTELDPTHVTVEVEGEFLFVDYGLVIRLCNYVSQIEMKRSASGWRRQVAEMRVALGRGMDRMLASIGRAGAAEYVRMASCDQWH
jgi:hypothetical protein